MRKNKVRLRIWFRDDITGTDYYTNFPWIYIRVLRLFNTIRAWKEYEYPGYRVINSWNIRDKI